MANTRTKAGDEQADEAFASGFAEEHTKTEQTEDEAFGLTPEEAPAANEPTGEAPAVAIVIDGEGKGENTDAPHGEMPAGGEGEAPVPAADAPALDVEKETQRLKSWEGRLKAKEAELAAKQAEGAAPVEADPAAAGEQDGDDADIQALSDDFGPEFVKMLRAVIAKEAKKCAMAAMEEHTAPMRKDVEAVIAEMVNDKQRAHFEKIADAHPDFMEVANSEPFKAWVGAKDEAEKASTEQIVQNGSAKEIIAMLTEYKASAAPAAGGSGDDFMDDQFDAAEGVRSTGLKLPEAPAGKDDFASAWNEH